MGAHVWWRREGTYLNLAEGKRCGRRIARWQRAIRYQQIKRQTKRREDMLSKARYSAWILANPDAVSHGTARATRYRRHAEVKSGAAQMLLSRAAVLREQNSGLLFRPRRKDPLRRR